MKLNKGKEKSLFEKVSKRRQNRVEDEDGYYLKIENPFWIDQNLKIALSKAYRRLEDKTQVFYSSERSNPHVRTRITHTTEVRSLASLICESLGLDYLLAEAIALGHDIGHVPFGHLGERFLTGKVKGKFRHNAFAVIVAEKVERKGRGLNLCYKTLEGIYYHSGSLTKFNYDLPEEYYAVRLADKIAYTFSDYNDAQREGIKLVTEKEKPTPFEDLGKNQRERGENVFKAIMRESVEEGKLSFKESKIAKKFKKAHNWMYKEIYPRADKEIDMNILERGYSYIKENDLFKQYNPAIVFGLLTEREVRYLAKLDSFDPVKIKETGILEVLEKVDKIEVNDFSSFPLKEEEFKFNF